MYRNTPFSVAPMEQIEEETLSQTEVEIGDKKH